MQAMHLSYTKFIIKAMEVNCNFYVIPDANLSFASFKRAPD